MLSEGLPSFEDKPVGCMGLQRVGPKDGHPGPQSGRQLYDYVNIGVLAEVGAVLI